MCRFITLQQNNPFFVPVSIKLHHVLLHLSCACVHAHVWKYVIKNILTYDLCMMLLMKFHCWLPFFHCSVPKLTFSTLFFFLFFYSFVPYLSVSSYLHIWFMDNTDGMCSITETFSGNKRVKGAYILVLMVSIRTYDVNAYRGPVCSPNREMPAHLFFHLSYSSCIICSLKKKSNLYLWQNHFRKMCCTYVWTYCM